MILEQILSVSLFQWIATIFGIFYIIFSIRNQPICWFFGVISCAIWAWVSYAELALYSDALLQIFYVLMGLYGLYQWKKDTRLDIFRRRDSISVHLKAIGAALILGTILSILMRYTEAAAIGIDAYTTAFSIIATFLLIYRFRGNWIYWIVVDLVYVFLYWERGGYLFAILFIVYMILAVVGWIMWKKFPVK